MMNDKSIKYEFFPSPTSLSLTEPGQVMHLAVNETVITTSSIFVMWTKPEGNSSSYKVRWTDGTTNRNASVNETNMNITGLTAGVQYDISVVAVADDGWTEGEESNVSQYTSKYTFNFGLHCKIADKILNVKLCRAEELKV